MAGCRRYDVGFGKLQERDDHVRSHNRPSKCPERGCFYEEVGFANNQRLNRHISLCHTNPASHKFIFPRLSKSRPPTADERKRFRDAIRSENLDLVREMIHDNNYFQNRVITGSYTALQYAAKYGKVESARLLLHYGSNIGVVTRYGTALNVACDYGQVDMAQFLLSNPGCEVHADSKDKWGGTPLILLSSQRACSSQLLSVVRLLLEDHRVFSDRRNDGGKTPLSRLAARQNPDLLPVIKMFLERDEVDPDAKDSSGRTPLLQAASSGMAGVIEAFLQHGRVDVNARDDNGWTPLAWAVNRKDSEGVRVVKILLEHDGIDPDARDNEGRAPLLKAAKDGKAGVIEAFLQPGSRVDVNTRDAGGRTPLAWAVARLGSDAVPLVKMLLKHDGIDVNAADNKGWTPLFVAVSLGSAEVVNVFLQHGGVDFNARDNRGRTPLSLARESYEAMPLVVKALEEHGGVD